MNVLRTVMHCHTRGAHSLLLHVDPVVRLWVVDYLHNLHTNGLGQGEGAQRFAGQSIGFHQHHYNLDIHHVSGEVWNVFGAWFDSRYPAFRRCTYSSQLADGRAELIDTGKSSRVFVDYQQLKHGEPHHMLWDDMHTMAVPEGKTAAWLVRERPIPYPVDTAVHTTNPSFDTRGLYVEGDAADAEKLIALAGGHELVAGVLRHTLDATGSR